MIPFELQFDRILKMKQNEKNGCQVSTKWKNLNDSPFIFICFFFCSSLWSFHFTSFFYFYDQQWWIIIIIIIITSNNIINDDDDPIQTSDIDRKVMFCFLLVLFVLLPESAKINCWLIIMIIQIERENVQTWFFDWSLIFVFLLSTTIIILIDIHYDQTIQEYLLRDGNPFFDCLNLISKPKKIQTTAKEKNFKSKIKKKERKRNENRLKFKNKNAFYF